MRHTRGNVRPSGTKGIGRHMAVFAAATLVFAACGTDDGAMPVIRVSGAGGARGGQGGNGGEAGVAAGVPAAASGDAAKMSMVAWLEYELGAELPPLDEEAEAWTLRSEGVDEAFIADLAARLGVPGEVVTQSVEMGGGWSVGPTDGSEPSLWASADGTGWWSYSAAWGDSQASWSCPEVAVDPVPGDSGTDGTSDVEPAVGSTEGDTTVVSDECVEPEPPQNVPTADEAEQLFRQLLADVGVEQGDLTVDTYADEWTATVTATRQVGGMSTPLTWSASYGADAELTYASGTFAEPESVGSVPRIGTAAAFERLTSEDGWWGGWSGMAPMARSAEGGDVATTDATATDQAMPIEPVPGDSVPAPEPIIVTIVDVAESLWSIWDVEGAVWLVPAYDFIDADGGRYTVPAVPDEMIESEPVTPEPIAESSDAPAVTGDVPATPPVPVTEVAVDPNAEPEFPGGLDSLIGLTETEAEDTITAAGFTMRVVALDGEELAVTMDYRIDRVNVEVVDGVITSVRGIG